tara:strand:- start:1179 stop:1661 length:483 start_codon:yes stop_codon:yes gene_type:complete
MEANMANVNHSALTDPYLHEPKGAAAATSGQVYVANGSGSGTWTTKESLVELSLEGYIENISSASTVYVPIPFSGTIVKVVTVLEASIGSADATITVSNAAAASMGTITVAFTGSAAGDVDTLVPSSNNTVTAESFITIATDGASVNTAALRFVVIMDRT